MPKLFHKLQIAAVAVATLAGTLIAPARPASAVYCGDVRVVFAEGSGADIGQSSDYNHFMNRLNGYLRTFLPGLSTVFYALGTNSYGSHQYPAVDMSIFHPIRLVNAWATSGQTLAYGNSVQEGVDELRA